MRPPARLTGPGILSLALAAIVATTVTDAPARAGPLPPFSTRTSEPPSIVLIVTDDQRWDTLSAMPNVERLLVDQGVTFENAFVVNSLCCPSRASILTGDYSHTTGVYANSGDDEGFDAASTVATWLDDGGYETGLFGKYLNMYPGGYVPPGWDAWNAIVMGPRLGGYYFDYTLGVGTGLRSYGHDLGDYSTSVLGSRAARFIRSADGPLFLYFAPWAPHGPGCRPRGRGCVRRPVPVPAAELRRARGGGQARVRPEPAGAHRRLDGHRRRLPARPVRDPPLRRSRGGRPGARAERDRPPRQHDDRIHVRQRLRLGRAPVAQQADAVRGEHQGADGRPVPAAGAEAPNGPAARPEHRSGADVRRPRRRGDAAGRRKEPRAAAGRVADAVAERVPDRARVHRRDARRPELLRRPVDPRAVRRVLDGRGGVLRHGHRPVPGVEPGGEPLHHRGPGRPRDAAAPHVRSPAPRDGTALRTNNVPCGTDGGPI